MKTHTGKIRENKNKAAPRNSFQEQNHENTPVLQLTDNRPKAILQRKLQEEIYNSPRVNQLKTIQQMANEHAAKKQTVSREADPNQDVAQLLVDKSLVKKEEKSKSDFFIKGKVLSDKGASSVVYKGTLTEEFSKEINKDRGIKEENTKYEYGEYDYEEEEPEEEKLIPLNDETEIVIKHVIAPSSDKQIRPEKMGVNNPNIPLEAEMPEILNKEHRKSEGISPKITPDTYAVVTIVDDKDKSKVLEYYIIMELSKEGSISTLAKKMKKTGFTPEFNTRAKRYCNSLYEGLKAMEASGFTSGDMKADNTLIVNDEAVLADFGDVTKGRHAGSENDLTDIMNTLFEKSGIGKKDWSYINNWRQDANLQWGQ